MNKGFLLLTLLILAALLFFVINQAENKAKPHGVYGTKSADTITAEATGADKKEESILPEPQQKSVDDDSKSSADEIRQIVKINGAITGVSQKTLHSGTGKYAQRYWISVHSKSGLLYGGAADVNGNFSIDLDYMRKSDESNVVYIVASYDSWINLTNYNTTNYSKYSFSKMIDLTQDNISIENLIMESPPLSKVIFKMPAEEGPDQQLDIVASEGSNPYKWDPSKSSASIKPATAGMEYYLPAGIFLNVLVSCKSGIVWMDNINLVTGDTKTIDIKPKYLSGVCVDSAGRPVANASISIMYEGIDSSWTFTNSDKDGKYKVGIAPQLTVSSLSVSISSEQTSKICLTLTKPDISALSTLVLENKQ
ncbi:MAG: carboxypeptidase regulatory-like domain-containing protein [Planctomycetes bacterium]|nr:carboxypeptidase regulatory-like domain-containing protein [Planctomycetota bacterium]